MATETTLAKVNVFSSESSYETNKSSIGENELSLVPLGMFPNYSAGIVNTLTYSEELTYTAPADGWIVWDLLCFNGEGYLTINGVDLMRRKTGGSSYMTTETGAIMVRKGDVIVARAYYNTSTANYTLYGSQTVRFFPFA